MSESDAKKQVGSFWDYIFGSKSANKKSYDLSTFIDLDKTSAENTLKKLQEIENSVKVGETTWQKYFSSLQDGQKWQAQFVQNNDLQKASIDDVIAANKAARDSAIQHNAALKAQTLGAKAAAVGMKALVIAGNMLAMIAIAKGIELAAKAIDNYVHRAEKAREALEESQSTYDSITKEVEDLTNQLDECGKKIKELENTKGINNLVDDGEYNKLLSTYDTLQDMLLVKKEEQRLEGIQLAKDAEKVLTTKVKSEFVQVEESGYTTPKEVLPEEELILAISRYRDFAKTKADIDQQIVNNTEARNKIADTDSAEYKNLLENHVQLSYLSDLYSSSMEKAATRANEIAQYNENAVLAYQKIVDNGGVLTESQQLSLNTSKMLNAEYTDLVKEIHSASLSVSQMNNASGANSNSLIKTKEEVSSLKDEVNTVTAAYITLNNALANQDTGKSVQLTEELSDYATCLEYVNGTMQISSAKARELAKAKADEKLATIEAQDAIEKAKYLENSRNIEQYTKLLGNNAFVMIDGIKVTDEYIQSLKDSNQQIIANCDQYALYAGQIRQATGSYQEWLDSQNASESGDMFTDAGNAIKALQEGLATGKINTIKYNAALKFLVPDSIDTNDSTAIKKYLSDLERYLADNGSGVNNFIADATKKGLIEPSGNGLSQVVKGKTIQDFVNELTITPEMARSIFGELEEYGWEFDWNTESIGGIEDALVVTKQTIDQLQEDINTKETLNIDSSEAQQALAEAKQSYDELAEKVVEHTNVQLDTDTFQEKLEEIQTLQELINQASVHGGDFSEAQEKLVSLKNQLAEISGLNTITIEAYIDGAATQLEDLKKKIESLPDGSSAQEAVQKEYERLSGKLDIVKILKVETDPSFTDATNAVNNLDNINIEDKEFTVIAHTDDAMQKLQAIKNILSGINNTNISPNVSSKPPENSNGNTSSVGGNARADGVYGTPKTERALVGELGREILVNPKTGRWNTVGDNGAEFITIPQGSIIFNHYQTEELLSRGFVNGHGSAYASGNAYAGKGGGSVIGGGKTTVIVHVPDTIAENAKELKESANSAKKITEEAEKQTKEFEWIKTATDAISREREKIVREIEDENTSYSKQLSYLKNLLATDREKVAINSQALDNYTNQWEEIQQKILDAFGDEDGNNLISKIMLGDASIKGWKSTFKYDPKDEAMSDKMKLVEDGQSIYSSLTDQEEEYYNSIDELTEDQRRQFEIRIDMLKSYLNEVEAEMSEAESALSIKETTGRVITESDYRDMINLADDQIGLQYEQIDALEEYLNELHEGSAEWYNVKSRISSCKNAIRQCEENQAKWNEEILNLPIRRVERYLEILEIIKKDITNKINEQDSLGIDATKEQLQDLIDISSLQIDKLKEQHNLLTDKLTNYEYGSDKFNEVKKEIQDVEDEISSLIQSQQNWNQQILQIPLNKITKLNDELQNILAALNEVTDRFDTTISAVTTAIEDQVKAVNDLKEAATKEYEAKLKPYQDELDLLQKQNKERSLQLALEQAAYDLDKAKRQKTTQVVRNGEIIYEADQDSIRSANISKADAEYNKTVNDLEQQIKSLEDERDALLENYDKQIEKLDDIKEKWSEIASNIEKAQNASIADEVLGSGWKDKILSGDDDTLYNMLKGNYENIAAQKDLYEKQIDSNEKIAALMEQYITAYQDGSMSYAQVVSQFDALINSAKDGFSALENLEAVIAATGNKDSNSALENLQNNISSSYNDFKEYLKAANTNSETISKYTSTWEEIKKSLEEQLAALKKLAEEESKKVSKSKPSSSGGGGGKGHSSSKGPNWNTPDGEATGPAKEIEEREKLKKSIPAYKDGIENGAVQQQANDIIAKLKRLGTEKLEHDEVLSILHPGEIVLNKEQQNLLLQNINNIPFITPMITPLPLAADSINKSPEFNFQTEINLNSVDNTQKLVDALNREWEPALRQAYSKL